MYHTLYCLTAVCRSIQDVRSRCGICGFNEGRIQGILGTVQEKDIAVIRRLDIRNTSVQVILGGAWLDHHLVAVIEVLINLN